jgi:hypothetical protein
MSNPVLAKQLAEFGLAPPGAILPALIRQHLHRRAVRRHAALEGFEHQCRFLMMRDRVRDDEARMIVHECRHVEPLMSSQQEGEDVRLPQLVGFGALEATRHRRGARDTLRLIIDESLLVQDSSDFVLRNTESRETRQEIADPTGPILRMIAPQLCHGVALRFVRFCSSLLFWFRARIRQAFDPMLAILSKPTRQRRLANTKRSRHIVDALALVNDFSQGAYPELQRITLSSAGPLFIRCVRLPSAACSRASVCIFRHSAPSFRRPLFGPSSRRC